jgi:carbon dioxide concentrating mechanism protein CcmL
MLLGKVVGTVVATQKETTLEGLKFLIVKAIDDRGEPTGATVVAADSVGAGVDEYVLYASGSSARQTRVTDKRPVDAVIMAIVDQWEVGGQTRYLKSQGLLGDSG